MAHAGGMYSKSSGVVDMDAKQFKEKVLKDKDGYGLSSFTRRGVAIAKR